MLSVLIGDGAMRFASQRGIPITDNTKMISEKAGKKFKKYKKLLEQSKHPMVHGLEIHVLTPQDQVLSFCY